MKTLILLFIVLFYLCRDSQEKEVVIESYVVGRFVIEKDPDGYTAQTDGKTSSHHDRMIKSIKEIQ